MGGKTLSDAQFFAVLNADVVEMIDGENSTTKRRYFRIAENDESITFSCILGLSQQQMVVTKATKQLIVSTTEIGGAIAPGSITSEMLADRAVTREKLVPGLDVSGLFFILPEGTLFPYTLTEEDKTKISAAIILILPTTNGVVPFQRGPQTAGIWCSLRYVSTFWAVTVSKRSISAPIAFKIVDDAAVKFVAQTLTDAQKLQARTNIGAAEGPNTSGDSQATLEEPPVADEEPIL